jgi:hypothetical protein
MKEPGEIPVEWETRKGYPEEVISVFVCILNVPKRLMC